MIFHYKFVSILYPLLLSKSSRWSDDPGDCMVKLSRASTNPFFWSRASTNPDIRQMVCLDLCHIGCIVLLDFPYLWCVAFFYFLQFDYWYVYAMSGFVVVSYKSCSNSCGHDSNLGMHVWGYISGDVGLPISFWRSWFSNRYFLVQGAVACWPCFQQSLFFSMDLHLIALHICMSRLQKVQRLLERQG